MSDDATPLISDATMRQIEEGQTMRGWIANSYAQIEFLLADLVWRCRSLSEYAELKAAKPSDNATELVKRVKGMLGLPGPLSPYADDLNSIIKRFEHHNWTRNLLAHGFCEYFMTPSGDAAFQFQKWQRGAERADDSRTIRQFRLSELKAEREVFVTLAQDAMRLFLRIHTDCGWVAVNEKPPPRFV